VSEVEARPGPLTGLRVLELADETGQFCGKLFGDLSLPAFDPRHDRVRHPVQVAGVLRAAEPDDGGQLDHDRPAVVGQGRRLHRLGLRYAVAIRSNHVVWTFPGQRVRRTRRTHWRPFERLFTDGSTQHRFIREIVFGQRHAKRFFEITTDPATLPPETTWDLMTNLPGKIERTVGNTFGLRTWIEIVCTQMTKTDVLAGGRRGDDRADLDIAIRDHHPIDEQFNQLALLLECGVVEAALDDSPWIWLTCPAVAIGRGGEADFSHQNRYSALP
jgi:hypothetical protein